MGGSAKESPAGICVAACNLAVYAEYSSFIPSLFRMVSARSYRFCKSELMLKKHPAKEQSPEKGFVAKTNIGSPKRSNTCNDRAAGGSVKGGKAMYEGYHAALDV